MKTENTDFICRVCLLTGTDETINWQSIFTSYNNLLISEHIQTIADVEINEGDRHPGWICFTCMQELLSALNFKLKCEKTNSYLQSMQGDHEDPANSEITATDVSNITTAKVKNIEEENIVQDTTDSVIDKCVEIDEYHEIKEEYSETEEYLVIKEECSEVEEEYCRIEEPNIKKYKKNANRKSQATDLQLECHDCGSFFKSKCKLRVHWKREHKLEWICPMCKRMFKSSKTYQLHKKLNICYKQAEQVNIVGVGRSRIFKCKFCEYNSSNIRHALQHNRTHTGERPHKCDICSMAFSQPTALASHREYVHEIHNDVIITCNQCGKVVKGRFRFKTHLDSHKRENVVQCDICKIFLKNKSSLRSHLKRHAPKQLTCEVCAKTFFTLTDLRNHHNYNHVRKRYKCTICEYSNRGKNIINKHIRKHNGTNVVCMICGQFVEGLKYLALHQKRHDSNRYPCIFCDKGFYTRRGLSHHICKVHQFQKSPLSSQNKSV